MKQPTLYSQGQPHCGKKPQKKRHQLSKILAILNEVVCNLISLFGFIKTQIKIVLNVKKKLLDR
jgi:hypothetical protein